jgi:hypothetical protein
MRLGISQKPRDDQVFSLSSMPNGGEGRGEEALISRSFFLNQHPEGVPALRGEIRRRIRDATASRARFRGLKLLSLPTFFRKSLSRFDGLSFLSWKACFGDRRAFVSRRRVFGLGNGPKLPASAMECAGRAAAATALFVRLPGSTPRAPRDPKRCRRCRSATALQDAARIPTGKCARGLA